MYNHLSFLLSIGIMFMNVEAFSQKSSTNDRQAISNIHYPIIITGIVKDSATKRGIPYAQITAFVKRKMKKGEFSDSLGNFRLVLGKKDIKRIPFNIKGSSLCYTPKTYFITELKDSLIYQDIYLARIEDCMFK
jgi:hypothetical protein